MSDIEQALARHVKGGALTDDDEDVVWYCVACHVPWPCPDWKAIARQAAIGAAAISQVGGWRFTGGDVREALRLLGPPGTKGEGIVMIAADAAATISDDVAAAIDHD